MNEHIVPELKRRPRRLRNNPVIREMVRENRLHAEDLIMPLFIKAGQGVRRPVASMPGIRQWSLDTMAEEIETILDSGIRQILLFGLPASKDAIGSDALSENGIIQSALRILRRDYPELYLITDLCMCEYTDHGHCGILEAHEVDNDATLPYLAKQALLHAQAGADMIAPSGMMDGMVQAVRSGLDAAAFEHIPIMSYSVKYASAFYGPFRDAAESAPGFGDRRSYQMDPANSREGMLEADLDVQEGADILMVKPALAYLDMVFRLKEKHSLPVACYNVSGEYSMIKAAAEKGWIDEEKVMMESLLSMKRAGADLIISYFSKDAARLLKTASF